MKRFKARKIKKKRKKVLFFFFFFVLVFVYVLVFKYLKKNKLNKTLLYKDINYINLNILKIIDDASYKYINTPTMLLNKNVKNAKKIEIKNTKKTKDNSIKLENDIKNVNESITYNPVVYIYNTHQIEKYSDYNVMDAANYLSDLVNNSYQTYYEKESMSLYLDNYNLNYSNSYKASRYYINLALNKFSSIKYLFDIHRDSCNKELTTLSYNGKSYAKILFVIGTDNKNMNKNEVTAKKLNEILNKKMPNISRGLMYHGGKGYNGVYNQDVNENTFLIEVGSEGNTKDEVINTINILSESIIEYIKDNNDKL